MQIIDVDPNLCSRWKFADRSRFEFGDIFALSKDIQLNGQIEPALLRKSVTQKDHYEIITGSRRWKACAEVNLPLKAIVQDLSDAQAAVAQIRENQKLPLCDYSKGMYKDTMSQDTPKSKTLTLRKPLSLTKQVEIANTMEIAKSTTPVPKPKAQDMSSRQEKDQTSSVSQKDMNKQKVPKPLPIDQKTGSSHNEGLKQKGSKTPTNEKEKTPKDQEALDHAAKREAQKQRFARINQASTWLCETYPNCFNAKDPKPLKIGISKDILEVMKREPSEGHPSVLTLRQALHHYTCNLLYHQAMIKSSHRIDLQGQTVDEITDQARTHAQGWIEVKELSKQKWQEKQRERKNLKHQAKLDNSTTQDLNSPSANPQIEILS